MRKTQEIRAFFNRTLHSPSDLNGVMGKINYIEILKRLPQIGVNTEAYIKLDDAKFIIGQIQKEIQADGTNLKSAASIKGFVEGLLYAHEEKDESDPTLETLRDILIYITT